MIVAIGATMLSGIPPTSAATVHVNGEAHGLALSVHSDLLPDAALDDVLVEASGAEATMDSNGIGVGSLVSSSSGTPLRAEASGAELLEVAKSEASAPPPMSAQDTVPDVDLPGVVAATTLHSEANASTGPAASDATATIEAATVGPPTAALVDATVITASASSTRSDAGFVVGGSSIGHAQVAFATVEVPGLTIEIEAATADAHAEVSSAPNSNGAGASCSVARITLNGTDILNPPCDGSSQDLLGLGLVTLTYGSPDARVGSATASASIDAITLTTSSGQTIVLGHADAFARVRTVDPGVCNATRPPSSGSSAGRVLGLTSPLTGTALEVAQANAAVADNSVPGTSHRAVGDAVGVHAHLDLGPVDQRFGGSRATAPPTMTDTDQLASLPPGLPITANTISSTATARSSKQVLPDASSRTTTANATLLVPGITGVNTTLDASAASTRRPSDVVSRGSSSAEHLNLMVGTTPITASVLQANAQASANGVPGGATASASYSIATLQVGGVTVAPIDREPGDVLVFPPAPLPPLVRLTFGTPVALMDPTGIAAASSIDAITVESLATGDRVVLGHAMAVATYAPAGARAFQKMSVDVGDDGITANDGAAHRGDVVAVAVCIGNTGIVTLTNVVTTIDLPAAFEIVDVPLGAGITGQRVTTAPITLPSGGTEQFTLLVRVRPDAALSSKGVTINATTTAAQLAAPLLNNTRVRIVA